MHVLVTQAKTRVTQAMGSQSCRQQQYALDLSGNVGAEVRLGRTISLECRPQKLARLKLVASIHTNIVQNVYSLESNKRGYLFLLHVAATLDNGCRSGPESMMRLAF